MKDYSYIHKRIIRSLLSASLFVFVVSCNSDDEKDLSTESSGEIVENIGITLAKRKAVHNIIETRDSEYDYREFNIDELIPFETKFDETSIIQVSQQTLTREPFKYEDEIFNFRYFENPEAQWDDDPLTYNFASYRQKIPLEWNHIGQGESYNGGYAMYALYFPLENQLRQKVVDNKIRYSVLQDQSILENLKKSDILGAYHSTEKLQSRIKFKMYHLMTYIRIRLYVPLYDDNKKTGYREDALQYATIDHVNNEFSIAWNASISSDTQGPSVDAIEGESEIIMYQHPLEEGETKHRIVSIPYKKFITPDYYDQGIEGDLDQVRIYDFSVIIPYQYAQRGSDGKMHNFTETNFLNFYFRTNSGSTTRYYFNQSFYAIDQDPDTNEENTLEMNQGYFQYMQLYVPRVGNQVIYLGGEIDPWVQSGGNMILEEDTTGE